MYTLKEQSKSHKISGKTIQVHLIKVLIKTATAGANLLVPSDNHRRLCYINIGASLKMNYKKYYLIEKRKIFKKS